MESKNTTHLAGEFLVAGELARRGYPVSMTFGNAKSVDIYVGTMEGVKKVVKKVDAKAGRGKTNWPIGESTHIDEDMFYVLVYLQTSERIKSNVAPEYFVVSGKEILRNDLVHSWEGGRRGIRYKDLKKPEYEGRWDKLGSPEQ